MKRILEIINLPSSAIEFIGGQFSYLHEKGGFEMHLICSPGEDIEEFCKNNKVKYQPVQLERQVSLVKDIKALFLICKYIKRNRIDIVIAHQAKGRLLGMLACAITGVRYRIIFAHGVVYETMKGAKRQLVMWNDRLVSKLSTKIVCVSNFVKDRRLIDKIDKPEKQIILGRGSCNGIDAIGKFNPERIDSKEIDELKTRYGLNSNDFVVGFCGRLVKDKGVVELVDAFTTLQKEHPEKSIKLLIIGNPENRDSLPEQTMRDLKQSVGIVFTGQIPYGDIQKYYLLMNVFVLPTHREGLGMVVLEASAMERPVVVSDYTGCAETIIPEVTGLYIDKTPQSIVKAVERCFDLNYAKEMGKKGREFVLSNFEHTLIREHVLELINSL